MTTNSLPSLLMVSEPGSFAEHTIVVRKPHIIAEVLRYTPYPPEVVAGLHALADEIATGVVAPLREEAADAAFWRQAWAPWEGYTWRQLGWFFAETYFYRRLLEVVRYFQPGPLYHLDPFEPQKRIAIAQGLGIIAALYQEPVETGSLHDEVVLWLQRSLWGNRADLSNITIRTHDPLESADWRLLIDHSEAVWELLVQGHVRRLDWIADNCGLELLVDLGLIDLLLSRGLVESIHLHLKGQPYFVSDAMPKDLGITLDELGRAPALALAVLSGRLRAAHDREQIIIHDHFFWTTCLSFWQLPDDLRATLAQSDLLLLKGDVNYRRLLDDRRWPHTSDLASLIEMPAPFVALRTLKGELMVGLAEGQAERLAQEDPRWLINGERGLIHLVNHPKRTS